MYLQFIPSVFIKFSMFDMPPIFEIFNRTRQHESNCFTFLTQNTVETTKLNKNYSNIFLLQISVFVI